MSTPVRTPMQRINMHLQDSVHTCILGRTETGKLLLNGGYPWKERSRQIG